MKQIIFELIYICLGIVAFFVRISLKSDADIVYYMSIVNQIAGFVTLIMIIYHSIGDMTKKIKNENKSLKRLNGIVAFSFVSILVYWIVIINIYNNFNPAEVNDIVTIITLVFALTDDLWSSVLQALFYKK